jgi:hypothetical protein
MDFIVAVDETSAVEHKTCVGRGRGSPVKIDASRNAIAGQRAGSVRKCPKNCIAGVVRPRAGFEGRVTAVNHLGKDKKVGCCHEAADCRVRRNSGPKAKTDLN